MARTACIFLSPDPARAGGLGYGYANANPMSVLDPTGNTGEDWITTVHDISTGVAIVAGGISLICTAVVICAEVDIVTAPLALIAGAISVATSDNTRHCVSGKGGCAGAVLEGAFLVAGGTFGLGAMSRIAAKGAPELTSGMERTGSALAKSDPFHRSVSWVVDNPADQRFAIKGGDGVSRESYQLPGELDGKPGVFEWIIDRSGTNPVIPHQRFIPGGGVTGFPNQAP